MEEEAVLDPPCLLRHLRRNGGVGAGGIVVCCSLNFPFALVPMPWTRQFEFAIHSRILRILFPAYRFISSCRLLHPSARHVLAISVL